MYLTTRASIRADKPKQHDSSASQLPRHNRRIYAVCQSPPPKKIYIYICNTHTCVHGSIVNAARTYDKSIETEKKRQMLLPEGEREQARSGERVADALLHLRQPDISLVRLAPPGLHQQRHSAPDLHHHHPRDALPEVRRNENRVGALVGRRNKKKTDEARHRYIACKRLAFLFSPDYGSHPQHAKCK